MEKITQLIKEILYEELESVKTLGVDNLCYRYFLPDGRSVGCPTIDQWYLEEKSEVFYFLQKRFLWEELQYLHQKKFSYVTRTDSNTSQEYLRWLKKFQMANALGIYKFGPERIDSVFFIFNDQFGKRRDVLINQIPLLETHMNSIAHKIDKIFYYIKKEYSTELLFDRETFKELFSQYTNRSRIYLEGSLNILFKGRTVDLSKKDIEIMRHLALGANYSNIAGTLGVSVKTVQSYVTLLKKKFLSNSIGELIHALNTPQIKVILKQI